MSALVSRIQIQKIRITDKDGVEHEFEGEGYLRLSGHGNTVTEVQALVRVKE